MRKDKFVEIRKIPDSIVESGIHGACSSDVFLCLIFPLEECLDFLEEL